MSALIFGWMLIASAAPILGAPVHLDGYSFRPPAGFRMARMELFRGTLAGSVAESASAGRSLSAALVDGEGESAASLLVSIVDEPFAPTPAAREEFSTWAARHLREELGLGFELTSALLRAEPSPRVEVVGTVREEDQLRYLLLAALGGQPRHAVFIFSAPSGRFEELRPQIAASLDTLRLTASMGAPVPRGMLGAALGAGLGALVVSWAIWRQRKKP